VRYTIRIDVPENPGAAIEFIGVDMGLPGMKTATLAAHRGDLIAIRLPGRPFQNGNYGTLSRDYAPAEIKVVRVLAHLVTGGLLVEELLDIPVKGGANAKPSASKARR
jgi:hypothetical protein